jgi:hypothetical protein
MCTLIDAYQEMAVQQSLSITQAIFSPTSTLGQTAMSALGLGAQYGVVLPFKTELNLIDR